MIDLKNYTSSIGKHFSIESAMPWSIIQNIALLINNKLQSLPDDFQIHGDIAIHRTAKIEEHVIMKGPLIIGENCFIAAHAYLRGGVFLAPKVSIGPGCEIKSSIVLNGSSLAHFNFVGDSIIGSKVNFEAGSIIANHFNERTDKTIRVCINKKIHTLNGVNKFGAVVGDECKVGANAVLSPGTILAPFYIVKRLQLIDQCPL